MEASTRTHGRPWAGLTQANSKVASQAFRLVSMTSAASRAFLARRDSMQTQPIARVYRARPQATIVAGNTFLFLMTGQTQFALVHGCVAVTSLPVVGVLHRSEAIRRQQTPFAEARLNHATATHVTQAAIATGALP